MAHQSTDHCVWNCLESVRGVPYELSNNTGLHSIAQHSAILYKKSIKFGIQEELQVLFNFLDTKMS